MTSRYDYIAIEPARGATYPAPGEPETFAIYGYGTYEPWSVNAGQEKRSYIDGGFATVEEARKGAAAAVAEGRIPKGTAVEVSESTGYRPVTVPHEPPAWFDEANAGESWDDGY